MTRIRVLEYLGLRRAPGSRRDAAERVANAVLLVGIALVTFLTRDLGTWTQVLVIIAASLAVGLVAGAVGLAVRRRAFR